MNSNYALTYNLTPREREVLGLIADGLSNQEIANRLGIRERTARHHTYLLYQKLEISSRAEAISLVLNEKIHQAEGEVLELRQHIEDARIELDRMNFFMARSVEILQKLGSK